MQTQEREAYNQITNRIIGAAIEVHKRVGPGLLEGAYQQCLAIELSHRQIPFEKEKQLAVSYRDTPIGTTYRLDFLVLDKVVVELKAVKKIESVHKAQILSYMKLGGYKCGLLLNFNVGLLKNGIDRFLL